AHQLRAAVDLGRARPALPRLAVPADREIRRLRRLDLVDRVEHDHPGDDVDGVVLEMPAGFVRPPDLERRLGHDCCSSMICFSSAGIGGSGTRARSIEPSALRRVTMLNVPYSATFSG